MRPDDKGVKLIAVAEVLLIDSYIPVIPDLFAPLSLAVVIAICCTLWQRLSDCCCGIKVSINDFEFVVVVLIWLQIGKLIVERSVRIVCVIHAASKVWIIVDLILMSKSKGMADLLTHHELSPGRSIVGCDIKVCIIHFGDTLGDMTAAYPDLGKPKPAVVPVRVVTYLHTACCWSASPRILCARDNGCIKDRRETPVT